MKYFIIPSLFLMTGCWQSPKTTNIIDTSIYAMFKPDTKNDWGQFDKSSKPAELSADEVAELEQIIDDKAASYNKSEIALKDSLNKLDKPKNKNYVIYYDTINRPEIYHKQLIAVVDNKGHKIVWANCLKTQDAGWKKYVSIVADGGAYFFQIKIDLTEKKIIYFMVNAEA